MRRPSTLGARRMQDAFRVEMRGRRGLARAPDFGARRVELRAGVLHRDGEVGIRQRRDDGTRLDVRARAYQDRRDRAVGDRRDDVHPIGCERAARHHVAFERSAAHRVDHERIAFDRGPVPTAPREQDGRGPDDHPDDGEHGHEGDERPHELGSAARAYDVHAIRTAARRSDRRASRAGPAPGPRRSRRARRSR